MDIDEKIKKIEDEIQKTPYNKATSHHIGKLKAKISKLREVTTLDIVPGVMDYKGAKIQIFDIPGIITGAAGGKGRGREILSVARSADLIIVVLDVFNPKHLEVILRELRDVGIRPNEKEPDVTVKRKKLGGVHVSSTTKLTHLDEKTIRSIINEYGMHNADVLLRDDVTIDQFIDALEANNEDPLIIKEGSTVKDVCGKLHRDFVRNFRHANIWGNSVKFESQKVGFDHVLNDKDVLRIILKK